MAFRSLNNDASSTPDKDIGAKFTITTSSPTDIWRKPPNTNVFTAPMIYRTINVSSFRRTRITASAPWKTLYDQGGILIVLPQRQSAMSASSAARLDIRDDPQRRWIKAGVEFYTGKPMMSVVVADHWADWSLVPLPSSAKGRMTVEVEREMKDDGSPGTVLIVSLIGADNQKTIIREVTAAFWDLDERDEMWVGACAAKPKQGDASDTELTVEFEGFEIECA